jgi:hypothetical protein
MNPKYLRNRAGQAWKDCHDSHKSARLRALLTRAPAPRCEEPSPGDSEANNLGVTGDITALDPGAKTLTVIGPNKEAVFVTNKDRIIMNGDKSVGLGDLKKGWHVEVSFDNITGKRRREPPRWPGPRRYRLQR